MIHILGICGSPVQDSNTEAFLKKAIEDIESTDVNIDIFTVQEKRLEGCRHCNWCMFKQTENKYCAIDDGMAELYPKVVKADALIVATPVYLGRLSGHTASVLDRLRAVHYGKHYLGGMKHKVGAALAVSWYRNSGIETTLNSVHWAFMTFQMVIAVPGSFSTFGGGGLSSIAGTGEIDAKDKHLVLRDEYGLKSAKATAKSLLELARIIKAGKAAV